MAPGFNQTKILVAIWVKSVLSSYVPVRGDMLFIPATKIHQWLIRALCVYVFGFDHVSHFSL